MQIRRVLLLMAVLSFIGIRPVLGQYHYQFDAYSTEALRLAADFRLDKARSQAKIARQLYPSGNIPVWVENYVDFVTLLNSEDEQLYRQLAKNKKDRLKRLQEGRPDSPYHLYCQAQFTLQWALIHMKFKDYLTGFGEADQAYKLLQKSHAQYPDFAPAQAGVGLMQVIVGSIPDNYSWIRRILGYKGTVEDGLAELEAAFRKTVKDDNLFWLEDEIVFYLSFIYLNLESGKDQALVFRDSYLKNKGLGLIGLSPIKAYAFSKISLVSGRNQEAIGIIRGRRHFSDETDFHFLTYMLANAYQNKLSDSSHIYFDRFIAYPSVKNFKKACLQRKAWQYLIKGDAQAYGNTLNRIPATGQAETDSDKQALREAQSGSPPNVALLKARLLFDGGYYAQSLGVLSENAAIGKSFTETEKVEYQYRLGRIYDELSQNPDAIRHYTNALEQGEGLPEYFAANSALKLAMLYEREGNIIKANTLYKRAMDMKFTEYRNSIVQKAKVGYERTKRVINNG